MSDDELNMALAEGLTAIITASEENIPEATEALELQEVSESEPDLQEAPEAPSSAAMVTIEPPESATAIETSTDEAELVLQGVESELTQPDTDDFAIVDEPAPKVGFVKRWTRKVVGWVKRVIKWAKE